MDDRELEVRLRTHLHRRLDDIDAPQELRRGLEQALASAAQPVVVRGFRVRPRMQLGLSLAAGAALVLAIAVAASLGLKGGIGGRSATPSPTAGASGAIPAERDFLVLPPSIGLPDKAIASVAGDILSARLRALGVGNFSLGGGDAMTITILDRTGPSDDMIRAVLAATGDVEFVPLPPADYGNQQGSGPLTAVVGAPLPKPEPALFGRGAIASAAFGDGNPAPLVITLTPTARDAFGQWSVGHTGEAIAIVVDSKVVIVSFVQEAISNGTITIEPATNGPFEAVGTAVLIGGQLPAAWRGATVPTVIDRTDAVQIALRGQPQGTTMTSVELAPLHLGIGRWIAVWNVALAGTFEAPCASAAGSSACPAASMLVVLDAETGGEITTEVPAP